jgi:hypothetical protein
VTETYWDPYSDRDWRKRNKKLVGSMEELAIWSAQKELGLWETFATPKETTSFVEEYDHRKEDLLQKLDDTSLETMRETLENLDKIIEALPETDPQELAFLYLYREYISDEIESEEIAENDPEYRARLEEIKAIHKREREAEKQAREFLERTKPKRST